MKRFLCLCTAAALILGVSLMSGCDAISKHLYTEYYGALTWVTTDVEEGTRLYADGAVIGEYAKGVDAAILRLPEGNHEIEIVSYKGDKESKTVGFNYNVPQLSKSVFSSGAEFASSQEEGDEYFFYENQHLVFDYRNTGLTSDRIDKRINIASTVKKVSILSDAKIDLEASFLILKRNEDIEFELENVNLRGLKNTEYVIDYDGSPQESGGGLILKAFGARNSVQSGYKASNGARGEHSQGFAFGKHATSGTAGGNGGGAVRANKFIIISEHDAAFSASDGGKGGDGGDADGANNSGNGGSGGKGGNAVECVTAELFLLDGNLIASGGKGGVGGSGGKGGIRDGGNGAIGADGVGINAQTKTELYGSFGGKDDEKNA